MSGNTPTKRDQIIQDLRSMILSGELPRGARLPQDKLAQQFDSSITPVREALRSLESENLVVSEPHRGVRVAGINVDRVKAIYIMRRLAESYAMRRAAIRLSPHELRQVEQILTRLNEASDRRDTTQIRLLNKDFHFFFYERCGLPALADEIYTLWRAFPWDLLLAIPGLSEASRQEHQAILDAVKAGNSEQAAHALEAHLSRSFAHLMERFEENTAQDPFDIEAE